MSTDTRYTLHITMHMRLSRGGYAYAYAIKYEGVEIGGLSVARSTRGSAEKRVYFFDDQEFTDVESFKAAHQATLK